MVPGHQGGESETILGKWFARSGKRSEVVLATKVGMDLGEGKKGLGKRYILEAAEASLKRLQTDHIDLYQSHKDDESTPLEETLEAYRQLIEQGKVRLIGASNYTGERLRLAIDVAAARASPPTRRCSRSTTSTLASPTNPTSRPWPKSMGLGVVPYFSLAAGFLTGKYKSKQDTEGASEPRRSENTSTTAECAS